MITTKQFFLLYIFIIVGSVFVRKLIDVPDNQRNKADMQVLSLTGTENARNIIIEEKHSPVEDTTMKNVDDDFSKNQLA